MIRSGSELATVAIAALCTCTTASADERPRSCSPATLSGNWVLAGSGYAMIGGAWVPKAVVQQMHFAGDGTLTVPAGTIANRTGDGSVTPLAPVALTGVYTLLPDCVGKYAINGGPSFDLYADPDGREAWMIQTNPNNVFEVRIVRID